MSPPLAPEVDFEVLNDFCVVRWSIVFCMCSDFVAELLPLVFTWIYFRLSVSPMHNVNIASCSSLVMMVVEAIM